MAHRLALELKLLPMGHSHVEWLVMTHEVEKFVPLSQWRIPSKLSPDRKPKGKAPWEARKYKHVIFLGNPPGPLMPKKQTWGKVMAFYAGKDDKFSAVFSLMWIVFVWVHKAVQEWTGVCGGGNYTYECVVDVAVHPHRAHLLSCKLLCVWVTKRSMIKVCGVLYLNWSPTIL